MKTQKWTLRDDRKKQKSQTEAMEILQPGHGTSTMDANDGTFPHSPRTANKRKEEEERKKEKCTTPPHSQWGDTCPLTH